MPEPRRRRPKPDPAAGPAKGPSRSSPRGRPGFRGDSQPFEDVQKAVDKALGRTGAAARAPDPSPKHPAARRRSRQGPSSFPPGPPGAVVGLTHQHAPPRPILVVGGGRLGRRLMRRFPNAVVLERDPAKIPRLRQEFGAYRVYHGSGTLQDHLLMAGLRDAQAVVVATDEDDTNHEVSRLAVQAGVKQTVARVEHPEQAPRFRKLGVEPVAAPLPVTVEMIATLLSPGRPTIGQGVIATDAATHGVSIRDLKIDGDAVIVSILRQDHLVTPEPEERLLAGDVVTVMAHKEELPRALRQITGRDLILNPLDRLYVPLLSPGDLHRVFREAFMLAEHAGAELFVFAPEDAAEVVMEAERLAKQAELRFQSLLVDRKRFSRRLVEEIGEQDKTKGHGGLGQHLFFECIVTAPERPRGWRRLLRRRRLDRFLNRLDHPVVIARNQKRYRKILLVIDNTRRASMTVHHTMDLALIYGSDITALLPESVAGDEAYRLLRHLERTGKIYGVEVEERFVRGNPTLEFIVAVKSGAYDLIVVDWQGRSVKRDILRRVIEYGPRSTLVLP